MAAPYLTFNGLKLDLPGFAGAKDLTRLMALAPFRGPGNWVSQGVDGTTFRPKVLGQLEAGASFLVWGENDHNGAAHPDPWSGIRDNIEHIEATCKTATKTATALATMTYPDGATRSAQAHCTQVIPGLIQDDDFTGAAQIVVLNIVVPTGGLVA